MIVSIEVPLAQRRRGHSTAPKVSSPTFNHSTDHSCLSLIVVAHLAACSAADWALCSSM